MAKQCYCLVSIMELSDKLRRINESNKEDKSLQHKIYQLICILNGHGHAHNVAHVLHQDIQGASATRVLTLLRFVVKMVYTVYPLLNSFEYWLPDTLEMIYKRFCENRDTANKSRLLFLRNCWHYVFSSQTLQKIDQRLRKLNGNWPEFKYVNPRVEPQVPSSVVCLRPPMMLKSSASVEQSKSLLLKNRDESSRPKLATKEKTKNEKSSLLKLKTIENMGKEVTKKSSWARFQPLAFIKPPSARRSTTETTIRRSSSNKENNAQFYRQ